MTMLDQFLVETSHIHQLTLMDLIKVKPKILNFNSVYVSF